jgi:hypothetical protein
MDRMNRRIEQLLAEGFPGTEAIGQAFEEFRGGRREDGWNEHVKLTLLRAPEDESHQSSSFQKEILEFDSALKASGVNSSARWLTQDSEHGWCGYVGVLVVALPTIIPAVKAVIIAYMKRRTGRKVQIEFDDLKVKVEEPTAEEADRVLKIIEQRHEAGRKKK